MERSTEPQPVVGAATPSRVRAELRAVLGPPRWRGRLATAPLRPLPDFLIIGGQKCGTSAVYEHLARHPRVERARTKEIHYFDVGFGNGERWYRAHFPLRRRPVGSQPVTGEASPYYLFHPLAPSRARELVPDARLIVLLRDPVARAVSHHNHRVSAGVETLPLAAALDAEEERLAGEAERIVSEPGYDSFNHREFSYLSRGRYAEQLERWFAAFDREQILVLQFDELARDPGDTMRRVHEFVGLEHVELPDYLAYGARAHAPADTELSERLRDYFRPHDDKLAELLGCELGWRTRTLQRS